MLTGSSSLVGACGQTAGPIVALGGLRRGSCLQRAPPGTSELRFLRRCKLLGHTWGKAWPERLHARLARSQKYLHPSRADGEQCRAWGQTFTASSSAAGIAGWTRTIARGTRSSTFRISTTGATTLPSGPCSVSATPPHSAHLPIIEASLMTCRKRSSLTSSPGVMSCTASPGSPGRS